MADGPVAVEALGARLMDDIAAVVPVLAVPLVAAALVQGGEGPLEVRVAALAAQLHAAGAVLKLPPAGIVQAVIDGMAPMVARKIVTADGGVLPSGQGLLAFYAAPVLQRLGENAAMPQT